MSAEAERGYKLLDHTADAGVLAWGPSPEAAFGEAARGMFAIVLGAEAPTFAQGHTLDTLNVCVEGATWDTLLVNWLAELVFHFDVDGFVPTEITFDECAPPRCTATLTGIYMNDPKEAGGVGIKAVTYHQLSVEVTPARTEAHVIFDI